LFQNLLPLLLSVALGCRGQGAGRQQTLKSLGDPVSVFQNILTLNMAVFHRKPDGKRKIYPISILVFGSVFSSASVNILEAEVCPDHVHVLLEIPPKIAVSSFMGYLKGKSSTMLYWQFGEVKVLTNPPLQK